MVRKCTSHTKRSANESENGTKSTKSRCKSINKDIRRAKNSKGQEINKQNSKPKYRSINTSNNNVSFKRDTFKNVKCVYFNARSIVNKQKELELLITEEELDIVGIVGKS
jgi:hypothetical protein